jgi:hypothetical protein
MFLMANFK